MAAIIFTTREVQLAVESSFNELAGTPGSITYTKRLAVRDARVTLGQPRGTDGSVQNRQNESRPGFLGVRTATIEVDILCHGANASTAAGALPTPALYTMLANALGGGDATMVGGTAAGGATATSLPYAAATLLRGGGFRVGAKNDGRADGQWVVAGGAPVTSPAPMLTSMAGVPNNGDIIYAGLQVFPSETTGSSVRFGVGWASAGAQYHLTGAQLTRAVLKHTYGDLPMWTLTYECAYWQPGSFTIPSGMTEEDCKSALVGGGSLYFQTFGTATRATLTPRSIELTLEVGTSWQDGPGGQPYQVHMGAFRARVIPTVKLSLDRGAVGSTFINDFLTDGSDSTHKHLLFTINTDTTGRAVGWYMPRAYLIGQAPTFESYNDMLYQSVEYRGRESTDLTSDLSRSAIRFFMG